MNIAESLGYKFLVKQADGSVKQEFGRNCPDSYLEKCKQLAKGDQRLAADLLLQYTVETVENGKVTRESKPPAVAPVPESEYFDDGMGPSGVWERQPDPHPGEVTSPTSYPPVMPKALVAPSVLLHLDENHPWADVLTAIRRLEDKVERLYDAIRQASESKPTAPGIGHGGGAGQASGGKPVKKEHATRAVLEHKDGKVRVAFWDDDKPHLNFAVINATKTQTQWATLMNWLSPSLWEPMKAKDWVATFPEYDEPNVITGSWEISYTESDKLNSKGNPYKDIAGIRKV